MRPEGGGASTPNLVHPNLLDSAFCCQAGKVCHFQTVTQGEREVGGEGENRTCGK